MSVAKYESPMPAPEVYVFIIVDVPLPGLIGPFYIEREGLHITGIMLNTAGHYLQSTAKECLRFSVLKQLRIIGSSSMTLIVFESVG